MILFLLDKSLLEEFFFFLELPFLVITLKPSLMGSIENFDPLFFFLDFWIGIYSPLFGI